MKPLQSQQWYAEHPKPIKADRNFDIETCKLGLRLSDTDYETLSVAVETTAKEIGIDFTDPKLNLQGHGWKTRMMPLVDQLINGNSARFGWGNIALNILNDYLLELVKKCKYNIRRRNPNKPGPQLPNTSAQPQIFETPPLAPITPSSQRSQAPSGAHSVSPFPMSTSTIPSFVPNREHRLADSILSLRRVANGEEYEDTIDCFIKPASKGIATDPQPNDYDFQLFLNAASEEIEYNNQRDIIRYYHTERGYLHITKDSQWRVALKYLLSQATSNVLRFEIILSSEIQNPTGTQPTNTSPPGTMLPFQPDIRTPVDPKIPMAPPGDTDRGASPIRNIIKHGPQLGPQLQQGSSDNTTPKNTSDEGTRTLNAETPKDAEDILANEGTRSSPQSISAMMQDPADEAQPYDEPQPLQNNPLQSSLMGPINTPTNGQPRNIREQQGLLSDKINNNNTEPNQPSNELAINNPELRPLATDNEIQKWNAGAGFTGIPNIIPGQHHIDENTSQYPKSSPTSKRPHSRDSNISKDCPQRKKQNQGNTALATTGSNNKDRENKKDNTREGLRDGNIITIYSSDNEKLSDDDERASDTDLPPKKMSEEERNRMIESLQSTPALTQLDTVMWEWVCNLLNHDPTKIARNDTFRIDGLRKPLFPHQAFAAAWLLRQYSLGFDTLFLADDMGVGKTATTLALWAISRNISTAWIEVQKSRNSSNLIQRNRHLPPNAKEGEKCPTNKRSIVCPCEPGSVSAQLAPKIRQGPILVVAQAGNVGVWRDECKAFIDMSNTQLSLKWHVQYLNYVIPKGELEKMRCDINTLEPKSSQNRNLVITSERILHSQILRSSLQLCPNESEFQARHPISWSMLIRDEYHTSKGENTIISEYFNTARIFRLNEIIPTGQEYAAPHVGRPLKLAISGTPMEGSPDDLSGHLSITVDPEWSSPYPGARYVTRTEIKDLSSEHKKLLTELGTIQDITDRRDLNKRVREYTTNFNNILRSILIRRAADSKFFTYEIIPMKPMEVNQIPCTTPQQYIESLRKYAQQSRREQEQQGNKQSQSLESGILSGTTAFFVRLAGDFPAILDLRDKHNDWTFHADEVYSLFEWDNIDSNNYYRRYLPELINSSPKIQMLDKHLAAMRKRSNEHEQRKELKEKMIITTQHPAILLILHLYFAKYQPKWKTLTIAVGSPPSIERRTDMLNGFCRRRDSSTYNKYADTDILLTSGSCIKTGLNLTAANNMVMFDPLWMRKDQQQIFARIHRFPQKRQTHIYLYYSPENPIERGSLDRQQRRGQLGAMTWAITEEEVKAQEEQRLREEERAARREAIRIQRLLDQDTV